MKSGEEKSRKVNTVNWNDQTKAEEWRSGWAALCNQYLEQNNHTERIDHRSYERQGVEQIPTIHLGVAASAMGKRGIRTERGDINREIAVSNNQLRQIRGRIKKLKSWIYTQPLVGAPTLIETMQGVAAGKNLDSQWTIISNLKTQAKLLIFLQQNGITDVPQLADKVTQIYERSYEVSGKIKSTERRLDTLAQHLSQYDNYKQHRAVYEKYHQFDPKKRDAFYDKHSAEIQSYEAAAQYLKAVMNGRKGLPIKEWKAEQTKLTAEKHALFDKYYMLKDDIRNVEVLRKGTENILREETQPTRAHEMEL